MDKHAFEIIKNNNENIHAQNQNIIKIANTKIRFRNGNYRIIEMNNVYNMYLSGLKSENIK